MPAKVDKTRPESQSGSARPRILIVITRADIGGAQMHVLQIIRELSEQFNFELAVGAEDFLTEQVKMLGVVVHVVPSLVRPIRPMSDWRAARALWVLIRTTRPALVHAHSFKAGVVTRAAALLAGVPCLFTAHGWAFTPGAPRVQRTLGFCIEWIVCRLCAGVVTISWHDYDLADRWWVGSRKRRYLARNAADSSLHRANPARNSHNLLTVGRLTPVKNQVLLLELIKRLPPQVCLEIVGEGPERRALERRAIALGVADRVRFLGKVTDISVALEDAGIFVLGSHFEGLPLSILEAMSAGLPVVSSDVGGVSEAVVDGRTGFLAPAGDVDSLAESVEKLLADPALCGEMGNAGYERFLDHFQVERFRNEMLSIYRKHL